jgi:lysophospholipase L1-like esterase
MRPVFAGHDPDWFNSDIHPNSDGSKAMAKQVWDVMTAACVGQKAGASCCE